MDNKSPHLPTARAVHEDTGLPYSRIFNVYHYQEQRTFRKHSDKLPQSIDKEEDIEKIMSAYEETIRIYESNLPERGKTVKHKWEAIKEQYRTALEEELRSVKEEIEYTVNLPNEIAEYRKENRENLVSYIEPKFEQLEDSQKLKIAYYFDGYAGLFDCFCSICSDTDLLLDCISVMTESAKTELKQYIESTEIKLSRSIIYCNSERIAWCQKIRKSRAGAELHKSHKTAWKVLKGKIEELDLCMTGDDYSRMLGIALIIDLLSDHVIKEEDLEIAMSFILFEQFQGGDVLRKILDMLTSENIKAGISETQVQKIRTSLKNANNDTLIAQERLERRLGLKVMAELYE